MKEITPAELEEMRRADEALDKEMAARRSPQEKAKPPAAGESSGPTWVVRCARCGVEIVARSPNRRYCGGCIHEMAMEKWASQRKRRQLQALMQYPSRPLTEDTAYLCQKWRREGMSVRETAIILSRPEKDILAALAVRLPKKRLAVMEEYLSPWKPREIQ